MKAQVIGFVTCKELPEPDSDQVLLAEACHAAGVRVELAAWDDPRVEWSRYCAAVLRSTWNYYEDPAAFLMWLERVDRVTRLWNPAKIVRENLDKAYLQNLSEIGVAIVPTRFLNDADELFQALSETGWEDFVLKPTVSAASFMTRRFLPGQSAEALKFAKGFGPRKILLQKFMDRVETAGEVALVFIDGQLTHAVHKHPRFHGEDEQTSDAVVPTAAQSEIARRILSTIAGPWLYARADLMEGDEGQWLLSELEMIEPSLFLREHPPALTLFVEALKKLTTAN